MGHWIGGAPKSLPLASRMHRSQHMIDDSQTRYKQQPFPLHDLSEYALWELYMNWKLNVWLLRTKTGQLWRYVIQRPKCPVLHRCSFFYNFSMCMHCVGPWDHFWMFWEIFTLREKGFLKTTSIWGQTTDLSPPRWCPRWDDQNGYMCSLLCTNQLHTKS
jgi:hypothetical protein